MDVEGASRTPEAIDRFGATDRRIAAASALRELGHAFVGRVASDELFFEIEAVADRLTRELERSPVRVRSLAWMGDADASPFGESPADGENLSHFPDCVVSGVANPMGIAIVVRREGDDAVAEIELGSAFEGAPGRAHGGVVAAIFDDVMGYQLSILKVPAFTGRIEISYRAPTPIGEPLEFRAWVEHREERKLHMVATAHTRSGRTLLAESRATFIVIPIDRFMPGNAEVRA